MKKKQIIGAFVAAFLFIVIGVSSALTNAASKEFLKNSAAQILTGGYEINPPRRDYIAVVEVNGTIQAQAEESLFTTPVGYQHITTLEYIDELINDPFNKGILLYVDSPGGTVYESEELYQKLGEYKESTKRPIWNYMAHYAASGGYYVGMMSDRIYANPNTTTGSIGVIISSYDMSGLYEKLGIKDVTITSGSNKANTFSEEQIAIYQSVVDESFARFVEIVAKGRGMTEEAVRTLADGRIYTAKQAQANGLIDEIALYETVQDTMSKELGVDYFYGLEKTDTLVSQLLGRIEQIVPKSEAQILNGLADETESGVLMYYAEQLK